MTPDRIFIFNKAFSLKRVPVRRWADVLHSIEHTAGGRDCWHTVHTRALAAFIGDDAQTGFATIAIISLERLP